MEMPNKSVVKAILLALGLTGGGAGTYYVVNMETGEVAPLAPTVVAPAEVSEPVAAYSEAQCLELWHDAMMNDVKGAELQAAGKDASEYEDKSQKLGQEFEANGCVRPDPEPEPVPEPVEPRSYSECLDEECRKAFLGACVRASGSTKTRKQCRAEFETQMRRER